MDPAGEETLWRPLSSSFSVSVLVLSAAKAQRRGLGANADDVAVIAQGRWLCGSSGDSLALGTRVMREEEAFMLIIVGKWVAILYLTVIYRF